MAILSHSQLETLWELNGGNPLDADTAAAVAQAESGGNTAAILNTAYPNRAGYRPPSAGAQPEYSVGLWQVNMLAHPGYTQAQLLTQEGNAQAAVAISGAGRSFAPWSTYTSGAYKQYLQRPGVPSGSSALVGSADAGAVAPDGHRGYADFRNSLGRHLPTQLERSRQTGLLTLRALAARRKVHG